MRRRMLLVLGRLHGGAVTQRCTNPGGLVEFSLRCYRAKQRRASLPPGVIDVHAHLANDLAESYPYRRADPETLLAEMEAHGVYWALVYANPYSTRNRVSNAAVIDRCATDPRLLPVGTFDWEGNHQQELAELSDHLRAFRLRGVKLYPGYQPFAADDPGLFELYRLLAELGLPLFVHCGVCNRDVQPPAELTLPRRLVPVAKTFPDLTVVMCHFGYPYLQEGVEVMQRCPNVYADTAGLYSAYASDAEQFARSADGLRGVFSSETIARRIFFGSDFPLAKLGDEIAFVRAMMPRQRLVPWVLAGNAQRVLGLYLDPRLAAHRNQIQTRILKMRVGLDCRGACSYCYQREEAPGPTLPPLEATALVRRAKAALPHLAVAELTGGEITDLWQPAEIAAFLAECAQLRLDTHVLTNGLTLLDHLPDRLYLHLATPLLDRSRPQIEAYARHRPKSLWAQLPVFAGGENPVEPLLELLARFDQVWLIPGAQPSAGWTGMAPESDEVATRRFAAWRDAVADQLRRLLDRLLALDIKVELGPFPPCLFDPPEYRTLATHPQVSFFSQCYFEKEALFVLEDGQTTQLCQGLRLRGRLDLDAPDALHIAHDAYLRQLQTAPLLDRCRQCRYHLLRLCHGGGCLADKEQRLVQLGRMEPYRSGP